MVALPLPSPVRARARWASVGVLSLLGAGLAPVPASAAPEPLQVVGLGDSVMAAGGCASCRSFLSTAAHRVAHRRYRPARVSNYAVGGFRSVDVLHQLRSTAVRNAVRRSDVVVIEVGANDFKESSARNPNCEPVVAAQCFTRPAATLRANLDRIASQVEALQRRPGARVVLMGYWNVFRDGRVGRANGSTYVAVSDELTRWVNSITWRVARRHHVRYADAYTPFKRAGDANGYLASDGDHPNAAGHALLAGAAVRALG